MTKWNDEKLNEMEGPWFFQETLQCLTQGQRWTCSSLHKGYIVFVLFYLYWNRSSALKGEFAASSETIAQKRWHDDWVNKKHNMIFVVEDGPGRWISSGRIHRRPVKDWPLGKVMRVGALRVINWGSPNPRRLVTINQIMFVMNYQLPLKTSDS